MMSSTFGSGSSDFLDLLAEVASRELEHQHPQHHQQDLQHPLQQEVQPKKARRQRRGRQNPRRLVDYDEFDVEHILRMSASTLLRLFAEQDFDEVARKYNYTCAFLPHQCRHRSSSFGSENRAKAAMRAHLLGHVRAIAEDPDKFGDFTAESVAARKRRMGDKFVLDSEVGNSKRQFEEVASPPVKRVKSEVVEKVESVVDDHDYYVSSATEVQPKFEESVRDVSVKEEGEEENLVDGWVQAVIEGRKMDLKNKDETDGEVSTQMLPCGEVPSVAMELEINSEKTSKKRMSRSNSFETEKVSEEEMEERKKALEAISELKSQGSTAVDFLCRICAPNRKFTAYTTLLSHLRSHAGVRPYECPQCNAVFTRQHSLNYHILIHDNKMRFTCEECGKKFRHPSHYKEHLRRHTGESPYECGECSVKYKTRNTFKRHLKVFHGKDLQVTGETKPLPEEELAKIAKSGDVEKEREKLERKKRKEDSHHVKTENNLEAEEISNDIDDDEVAKISKHLEETEGMLEGKVVIKGGGSVGSSSEGSYYPSTDSEFSSPEPTRASSPVVFGSAPPENLPCLTPNKGVEVVGDGVRDIMNKEKSPNLLETVAGSAFNPFQQSMKQANVEKSTIIPPVRQVAKPTVQVKVVQKQQPILASIDGKQVLLVPTGNPKVPSSSVATLVPKPVNTTTLVTIPKVVAEGGGQSKLEQCLRYGSKNVVVPASSSNNQQQQQKPIVVATSQSSAVGHTFVLTQPINLNLNGKTLQQQSVATTATTTTQPVRKINTIRLVPVPHGGSARPGATVTTVIRPNNILSTPSSGSQIKVLRALPAAATAQPRFLIATAAGVKGT